MFDKIEVLMSWKLSCGLSSCFLALVMDTFSSIFQIIAHMSVMESESFVNNSDLHHFGSFVSWSPTRADARTWRPL